MQRSSRFGDELVLEMTSLAQTFARSNEEAKQLTRAAIELSAATGMSLEGSMRNLGKTLSGLTGELGESLPQIKQFTQAQLQAGAAIDLILERFGGAAERDTLTFAGALAQAKNSAGDLAEVIGQQFAPELEAVTRAFTRFVDRLKSDEEFAASVGNVLKVGVALTTLTAVLATGTLAWIKFQKAMLLARIAIKSTTVSIRTLIGATGIGLLVLVVTDLAMNWQTRFKQMQAALEVFTNNVKDILSGLGMLMVGVFTANFAAIKEGFSRLKEAWTSGFEEFKEIRREQELEDREERKERDEEWFQEDLEKKRERDQQLLEIEKELRQKREREEKERRKRFIEDERKFGKVYAEINKAMHSDVFQGTKTAFGELEALNRSHNNVLKSIGKVAAVANIIIKTAQSAMNIYAGFSQIPIIGHALGIAGAAAAIAFGGEQIARVNSANQGGQIRAVAGNRPNTDSVPSMLTPGELIIPKPFRNEVLDTVARQRAGINPAASAQQFDEDDEPQEVMVSIEPDASKFISVQQRADRDLGVVS